MNKSITQMNGINCKHKKKSEWKKKNIDKKKKNIVGNNRGPPLVYPLTTQLHRLLRHIGSSFWNAIRDQSASSFDLGGVSQYTTGEE